MQYLNFFQFPIIYVFVNFDGYLEHKVIQESISDHYGFHVKTDFNNLYKVHITEIGNIEFQCIVNKIKWNKEKIILKKKYTLVLLHNC